MILTVLIAALAGLVDDDDTAKLLKKAKYPLTEAIGKAADLAKEGVLVSAELDDEDDKVVYIVEFAVGSKIVEITLDAATGDLIKKATEDEDQSEVVRAAKIPLSRGIEIAVAKVPGKVVAAEVEVEDGKAAIEVKVFAADKKVQKIKIDAVTGNVLSVKAKKN